MRSRVSIPPDYFDRLYGKTADPWSFETSAYERAKYETTLKALGRDGGDLLEIGCSIGVLTERLAGRCRRVLAIDVAERALATARARCRDVRNVEFQRIDMPRERPAGSFDTVLLSEVGYYWSKADLDRFASWLPVVLRARGRCILVHWTGETDYPLTGDEVHDRLIKKLTNTFWPERALRRPEYRLDVLRRLPFADEAAG